MKIWSTSRIHREWRNISPEGVLELGAPETDALKKFLEVRIRPDFMIPVRIKLGEYSDGEFKFEYPQSNSELVIRERTKNSSLELVKNFKNPPSARPKGSSLMEFSLNVENIEKGIVHKQGILLFLTREMLIL